MFEKVCKNFYSAAAHSFFFSFKPAEGWGARRRRVTGQSFATGIYWKNSKGAEKGVRGNRDGPHTFGPKPLPRALVASVPTVWELPS